MFENLNYIIKYTINTKNRNQHETKEEFKMMYEKEFDVEGKITKSLAVDEKENEHERSDEWKKKHYEEISKKCWQDAFELCEEWKPWFTMKRRPVKNFSIFAEEGIINDVILPES
ncbi:hypothetical protein RFI_07480 [Reticulomyxa filosa]|uniref:Uncharacterized protein n=1 Tax=Reticulomyxa filosa TaxID=46433 RepID=X6NUD0_RETFI|nr:hypothetical protein RFI_07480 [Reticulomyxa filosa]|eukprot:ETO29641.1 hypothetical protein RFI_07480 [Reticulomyxa filosa]